MSLRGLTAASLGKGDFTRRSWQMFDDTRGHVQTKMVFNENNRSAYTRNEIHNFAHHKYLCDQVSRPFMPSQDHY
jgi:hypothetical protein